MNPNHQTLPHEDVHGTDPARTVGLDPPSAVAPALRQVGDYEVLGEIARGATSPADPVIASGG